MLEAEGARSSSLNLAERPDLRGHDKRPTGPPTDLSCARFSPIRFSEWEDAWNKGY